MLHLIIGFQDSCIDSPIRYLFHSSGNPHLSWKDCSIIDKGKSLDTSRSTFVSTIHHLHLHLLVQQEIQDLMELMEIMSLKFWRGSALAWCSDSWAWGSVFLCANLFLGECCCWWCTATNPSQSPIAACSATGSAWHGHSSEPICPPLSDSTWEIACSTCKPKWCVIAPALFPTHWPSVL